MKLTTVATVLNTDVHNVWNKHYCYVGKKLQYLCFKVYLNNLAQWLRIYKTNEIIELQVNLETSNYYMTLKQNLEQLSKNKATIQ
jgi:hypothetical protein